MESERWINSSMDSILDRNQERSIRRRKQRRKRGRGSNQRRSSGGERETEIARFSDRRGRIGEEEEEGTGRARGIIRVDFEIQKRVDLSPSLF